VATREQAFDVLQEEIVGIANLVGEIDPEHSDSHVLRLLHLRFREDEPLISEFVDLLSDHLVNYAVPLSKRREAALRDVSSPSGGNLSFSQRLRREAVKTLIAYSEQTKARYGEVGELISYVIAAHFLRAPQIGSKLALKTSSEMPVHGVDGLHIRAERDGTVTFFTLESKLAPTAAQASREFCASASGYMLSKKQRENELRLVTDFSNLDALEGDARQQAKAYFNVYGDTDVALRRREMHVGSLVYSEDHYSSTLPKDPKRPITIHEDNFRALYQSRLSQHKKNLVNQAEAQSLRLDGCAVFFLAIPSVDDLKKLFAESNNGHIRD
jgi:Cap4 SAVED domain